MNKTEFVLNSLSKIKHKKWELYCISRIIHLIDDLDIEFICQQPIITSQGKLRLADLYFPQLNVYVEINEEHHFSQEGKRLDGFREREIFNVSEAVQLSVSVYDKVKKSYLNLEQIHSNLDHTITKLNQLINSYKVSGAFLPWGEKLSPKEKYKDLRELDVNKNISVNRQVEAINLFGRNYKGWQRGVWNVPNQNKVLWFPRLYKSKEWTNELTPDGKLIIEQRSDLSKINYDEDYKTRVVFGRYKNYLGKVVYRYCGEFIFEEEIDDGHARRFKRVSARTELPL